MWMSLHWRSCYWYERALLRGRKINTNILQSLQRFLTYIPKYTRLIYFKTQLHSNTRSNTLTQRTLDCNKAVKYIDSCVRHDNKLAFAFIIFHLLAFGLLESSAALSGGRVIFSYVQNRLKKVKFSFVIMVCLYPGGP